MKTLLSILATFTLAAAAFAEAPEFQKDLGKAVHSATTANKMAFILMGREACSNCQATKTMVREGKIPVTADTFVAADLNVDDQKTSAEFTRKYKKEQFGGTLPFVVITDSHGKALASSSGYKSPEQWTALIEDAKKKAGAVAAKR